MHPVGFVGSDESEPESEEGSGKASEEGSESGDDDDAKKVKAQKLKDQWSELVDGAHSTNQTARFQNLHCVGFITQHRKFLSALDNLSRDGACAVLMVRLPS